MLRTCIKFAHIMFIYSRVAMKNWREEERERREERGLQGEYNNSSFMNIGAAMTVEYGNIINALHGGVKAKGREMGGEDARYP